MTQLSHSLDRVDGSSRDGPSGDSNLLPPHPRSEIAIVPMPSPQSLRGLDWFIFFLADVQTGFGPFIAVYLTTQKWTQAEIGLVLSSFQPLRWRTLILYPCAFVMIAGPWLGVPSLESCDATLVSLLAGGVPMVVTLVHAWMRPPE